MCIMYIHMYIIYTIYMKYIFDADFDLILCKFLGQCSNNLRENT